MGLFFILLRLSSPPLPSPPLPSQDQNPVEDDLSCVPSVEACALVMLCNYRSVTRRLSLVLLKEVRALREALPWERKVSGGEGPV